MRSTLFFLAAAGPAVALSPRAAGSIATACAEVSASSSSYMAANPTATVALVDGPIVYDCLQSIPIDQQRAINLIESIVPYVELQSTLSYLKDPPQGYLYPGVHLADGLLNIISAVAAGKYAGEYDFQTDLQALLVSARDGHLSYQADLIGVAGFKVPNTPLASYSSDGVELPHIFCTSDLLALGPTGIDFRNTSIGVPYTPSALKTVNGMDVTEYLMGRAEEFSIQDPDAAWNWLFSETVQIAQLGVYGDGGFPNPAFYPGPETVMGFANGSFNHIPTGSEIYANFDGVTDGISAYKKFCGKTTFQNPSPPNITQQPSPVVPFYPWPVLKNSQNRVAGYFLNDTGNTDVAVLSILNFNAETNAAEFQQNVRDFIGACQSNNKTKLIIDLMGNGGGLVDLGIDTFTQLFPDIYPHAQGNMRASDVLKYLGEGDSALGLTSPLGAPFDVNSDEKPDSTPFSSWSELYGPVVRAGDNYTNLFEENINKDPTAVQISTGKGSRPFSVDKIVLVTDGYCADTCAVFSELMKNLAGVKSIAVGGRPQNGPMQYVGGTKGKQIFPYEYVLGNALNASQALTSAEAESANNTDFASLGEYPLIRAYNPETPGVNGQNNVRVGDTSVTPLQFVYEAADCRFFFTHEMLTSQVPIWSRAADISFNGATSQCIAHSTGHASSVSGGARNATNRGVGIAPPASAKLGSIIPLSVETNGTVGGNSTKAWGGKAWGAGGWDLSKPDPTTNSAPPDASATASANGAAQVASSLLSATLAFAVGAFALL